MVVLVGGQLWAKFGQRNKERPPNRKAKFNDFFFIVCFAICDEASRVGLSQLSHTVHASLREQKKNHFHTVSFPEF